MLATIKKTKKKRCYLDVDVNDGGDLHQNHRSANHRHCKPVKPQRLPPTQSLLKTHQHLKLPSLLTALSLALVLLFVIRSPRNVTYSESGQWTRHKLFCRKSWTSARRSPPAPPVAPEPSQLPLPSLDREQNCHCYCHPAKFKSSHSQPLYRYARGCVSTVGTHSARRQSSEIKATH